MYETPQLTKFGTFRQLTGGAYPNKSAIGQDLIPAIGGLDCDDKAPPGDPTGCIRS